MSADTELLGATLVAVSGGSSSVTTTVTLANVPTAGLVTADVLWAFTRRACELAGLDPRSFASSSVQRYSLDGTANVFLHRD